MEISTKERCHLCFHSCYFAGKNPKWFPVSVCDNHPIYKILRQHGHRFNRKKGIPIYATADGIVNSEKCGSGYGTTVIINHGNGYQTVYNIYRKTVKSGQSGLKRRVIGLMGSTGLSVSHLHYEVIKTEIK